MSNSFIGAGPLTHDREKPHLSALAQEILVRVTDGQTTKTIASALGTTRHTVNWQVRTLYRRFRVNGVALLVHAAIRGGWITHPAEQAPWRGFTNLLPLR
jgi:DNA-binding CsgD family transcriptional regulator